MTYRNILTAIALSAAVAVFADRPAVIPAPANYTLTSDAGTAFTMPARPGVAAADSRSAKAAASFVRHIGRMGVDARRASASSSQITVKLDEALGAERYTLEVKPSGVSIAAGSDAALMYAASTLAQLAEAGNGTVAACRIDDYPRFGYRGLMLDVVRCYIEPEAIKRFIDVAAQLKLNNLHLHLTDDNGWRLEIKKYPMLTKVGAWRVARPDLFPGRRNATGPDEPATEGGFYTQKQMRELVKYAAERNINIIPEIEMPAHSAAAIASYPSLACSVVDKFIGVFPGIGGKDANVIMCAGKEETFTFIQDVLDEVMDIFPSPTIHLGGDEANKTIWKKCPLCNDRIASENLDGHEGLQAYLMDRVNHYVRSKGRTAMGWDEVTYGDPKEDMIIYGWQGDGGVAVRDSRRSGRKFIMTPARSTYLIRYQGPQWFEPFTYFGNITLRDAYLFEPVGADWDDALRSNLLGIQGSLWSEFCKTPADVEYQVFPRLLAIADAAWRPEGSADWEAFLPALDAFTKRLDASGVTYARSMYNLDHKVCGDDKGALTASISCIRPDMEVRYSTADPSLADALPLTAPLTLTEPATVYAATFKDGKPMGRTLELRLDFNKATARPVTAATAGNGLAYTLTNGLRGSDRNSDFEWAGWHNQPAEFTVDLGSVQPVRSVSLGALVHADICVAAPKHIYVYTSENGSAFTLQRTVEVDPGLVYHDKARVLDIDCGGFEADARYVKFVAVNPGCIPDGLPREGAPTWMYFDEISIN
ncbi:MAG: family 20 glycosylhydrolase [Muribaculaceae bacterium]|nr:family 20 glycosylhydrolase [Muribaculaceae bacterium]